MGSGHTLEPTFLSLEGHGVGLMTCWENTWGCFLGTAASLAGGDGEQWARDAVQAMGDGLLGSARPLLVLGRAVRGNEGAVRA
jgi:hypothetical protein